MWGSYVDHGSSGVGHVCVRHICSGAYVSSVKGMYICVPGHIFDCIT